MSFDLLDLAIVALATAAAVGGWRLGLAARAASWVGMVLGILAATRILPAILRWQRGGRQDQVLAIFFIVLIGGAFIGQLIGLVIGTRLRLAIPPGPLRSADRAGGAAAGVIGVLFSFWLLLPSMADIPEWPAREARNSAIAAVLHDHLPRPPDAVLALRQLVGEDVYPRVFESLDAAPDLGPPPAESGLTKETADRVAASTVKVESTACGRIVEGSGSVIGDELIETNAHVVAGGSAVTVLRHPDGVALNAEVVAFDPNRDLAILHVSGIDRPALPVRTLRLRRGRRGRGLRPSARRTAPARTLQGRLRGHRQRPRHLRQPHHAATRVHPGRAAAAGGLGERARQPCR